MDIIHRYPSKVIKIFNYSAVMHAAKFVYMWKSMAQLIFEIYVIYYDVINAFYDIDSN